MKKSLPLLAGALLAVTTLSVSAKDIMFKPGVYVGLDAGFAGTRKNEGRPGYRTYIEQTTVGFARGMLGYQFSPNLALEAGYFSTGDARLNQTNGTRISSVTSDASGSDLLAVFKSTEYLPGVFVKSGLSYAKASLSQFSDEGSRRTVNSGVGYVLGLGYEYDFSQHWSGNVGYTFYGRTAGLSGNSIGVIAAGVKYRF
jgi:opacity protein-like surface antigen